MINNVDNMKYMDFTNMNYSDTEEVKTMVDTPVDEVKKDKGK
jgi:hypothetical protein